MDPPKFDQRLAFLLVFIVLLLVYLGVVLFRPSLFSEIFKTKLKETDRQLLPLPSPNLSPGYLLSQRAKTLGYQITFILPTDNVGRTVFYEGRGSASFGGKGWQVESSAERTTYMRYLTALFASLEPADNPQEYLLNLKVTDGGIYPPIKILGGQNPTQLGIEDLAFLPTSQILAKETLGPFFGQKESLKKILKPGDALVVVFALKEEEGKKKNLKDEKGLLVASEIYLRRFGGKEQLEKEGLGQE